MISSVYAATVQLSVPNSASCCPLIVSYSAPPAGFKGAYFYKGREGVAEKGERRNDGSSGKGSGGERDEVPRPLNFGPPQP